MRTVFIVFLLWAGALLGANAQETRPLTWRISGAVGDSATGKPLSRAAIIIDYDKGSRGTYTDASGYFALDLPPGNHTMVVRHLGYVTFRKAFLLRQHETFTLKLPTIASQLEEVIITSKGYDRTIRQPLLGVAQINMAALRRMPAALGEVDILRSLQLLPGVTSVGEAANGVNIRGGTTDQNLILLDDTPILNPTHMFGLFSVFPPDAVSSLDLYKGNVPARFGGRAAAVLDISLKNPDLEKVTLTGGISLVSNKLTLGVPLAKGRLGLLVSGRGAFNSFMLPWISPQLSNIRANFGDGTTKLFWRIGGRHTLTAMGYASYDAFQTNLIGSIANINAVSTRYAHQTLNGSLRWFWGLSDQLNLVTTVSVATYRPDIISTEPDDNLVLLRQRLRQWQAKTSLGLSRQTSKSEVGLSVTRYDLNPGELQPNRSQAVNPAQTPYEQGVELALFADHEREFSDRLAVSLGLRLSGFANLGPDLVRQYQPGRLPNDAYVIDSVRYGTGQVTARYGGPEPRLGLRYSLTPDASVKIGYNLMRQYLQQITNTTTPLPTSRWKTADGFIRPQVSQLWSAGWFQNLKQSIYEVSAEVYYRTTRHSLDYKPGANFLLQSHPETQLLSGQGRAYGLELMVARKKGELTGWVNYTYSRTQNRVDAGPAFSERINGGHWYAANYDRPHNVNASINLNQTRHHSFAFNIAYSTGRPYSAPEGFIRYQGRTYPYYNARNEYRLPAYHRLDFAWNIHNPSLKNRRWQGHWTFTVYNLYGRKNAYSIYYKTEQQATNPFRLSIFAAPLPSLAYNIEFK